jgi:hypothetical protein
MPVKKQTSRFRGLKNRTSKTHVFIAAAALIAVFVVVGVSVKSFSHAASGGYGHTFCGGSTFGCLNAWNGGPWVNDYGNAHVGNDDFYSVSLTNGATTYIMDSGANAWSGNCIGDAYNSSGNPLASLDPCPGSSKGAGWGTYFQVVSTNICPAGSVAFKNKRWHGFLAPVNGYSSTNGNHFTVNGLLYCFSIGPAV